MRSNLVSVVVAVLSAGAFACGGGVAPSGAAPATDQDAGTDTGPVTTPAEAGAPMEAAPPADHGAPSTTYPAFPVAGGQLQDNGGYKMKAPIIVAITWNSDPAQATFDAYADGIGATAFWKTAVSEWGVGPATSGTVNHVHIATPPPASMLEGQTSDFQNLVTTNAGVTNGWPAPTPDTIYAFFLAPGTSLQLDSGGGGPQDACGQGVGGFHNEVAVGSVVAAYAVVDSCNWGIMPSATEQTYAAMSHELSEAVTDPQPQSVPAITGFQADSFAFDYSMTFMAENGDACAVFSQGPDSSFYEDIETTPGPFDYWVQREWSNKSSAAGHNPCVPAPADPYFNVTPLGLQTVNVSLPPQFTGSSSSQLQPIKGYKVAAGTSEKFAVGFFSDAPTSGPWMISATTGNPLTGGGDPLAQFNASKITVKVDKASGQNGEKAWVTVDVTSSGTAFKGEMVTIISSLKGVEHYMPIWISAQ